MTTPRADARSTLGGRRGLRHMSTEPGGVTRTLAPVSDASRGLLSSVRSPRDLKALSAEQMPELADEIRAFLIEQVSQTGGHLGPNLGVVELTLAIHRVFTS